MYSDHNESSLQPWRVRDQHLLYYPSNKDGVGLVGWAVPALLVLGFGGPEPVVGQLSMKVALDFLGRYAFTRPPAAGLRPLPDPSTDGKAADDENS